ncbi:MAG TPA: DNA-directed RNA polymerase subunit omega [Verrucomicrobiae bacterium]|nr:DNA-directed RNA polymerase subunit omega [Verrucomicrobiae bacterium]
MNSDICKKALEKVGNPNILVNLISRRVRQLTGAGGTGGRPLIAETAGLGAADIALLELVEGKMDYEIVEDHAVAANGDSQPTKKKKKG